MLRFFKKLQCSKKIYIIQINSKNHKKITEGVNGLGSNIQKKLDQYSTYIGSYKKTTVLGVKTAYAIIFINQNVQKNLYNLNQLKHSKKTEGMYGYGAHVQKIWKPYSS